MVANGGGNDAGATGLASCRRSRLRIYPGPHPEELAKQASRRMAAKRGLAAILRDARKGALLRMRSEICFTTAFAVSDDGALIAELLAQDALFQAVAGVEQHPHRDGLVGKHLVPA